MNHSASSRSLTSVQSHAESVRDAIIDEYATPLTDEEIQEFLDDLDHNNDGKISYKEIEAKLDQVHDEIAPHPLPHHLHHDSKEDTARHEFLKSLIGIDSGSISRTEMATRIKGWGIPSTKQDTEGEEAEAEYLRRFTWVRRFRSYWSVRGPEIMFIALVVIMILAFCLWQLIKYITQLQFRAAFGWGVVLAKASAGAIYPTFFFVLLSMSRYFSTFLRRWYHISRFINWDLSQRFHIAVSCLVVVLATLHAIGHLSGTFVYGSRSNREPAVNNLLNGALGPQPHYIDYIRSLPGITGLVALGLLYTLAILSMPQVRKWNYEVFQLGHLLMYPIIGLLCAHGSAALLQQPMLGYFMAFPALLVVVERIVRVLVGFRPLPATIRILDSETVEIKVDIPGEIIWKYRPGQWVFLQVPKLSLFQWHPFTISVCLERQVQLHIKTDGNWTKRLRDLVPKGRSEGAINIGLNGPFGAPAERFYDFSHTLLIGAGIGVTPFSGILADLQAKDNRIHGGPRDFEVGRVHPDEADKPDVIRGSRSTTSVNTVTNEKPKSQKRRDYNEKNMAGQPISTKAKSQQKKKKSRDDQNDLSLTRSLTQSLSRSVSRARSRMGSRRPSRQDSRNGAPTFAEDYRRVDFHWMVRDKNSLGWFSNLLNTISRSQIWHRSHDENAFPHLDIRLSTHVTQKRKSIVTHVYRWLLELHRTDDHPESPLTGLINPTHYGRPDFTRILDKHYEDMVRFRQETGDEGEKLKVGVFFCGSPVIGEILADQCRLLTNRGEVEGTLIRYHFMIEVFG